MASIKLLVKTKKDPVNLYLRFNYSNLGKTYDLFVKSGILVKKKWWSNKKQNFNTVTEDFSREELYNSINKLKIFVIAEFNKCYNQGEIIDRIWLENIIDKFNKRIKSPEGNYKIYFIPFVEKFIDESKKRINLDTGKPIKDNTIKKYNTTLSRLKEFEEIHNSRLKHSDINLQFHNQFTYYLSKNCQYGGSTISKYISQVKTFCREVETCGYEINPEYKSPRFTFKRQKALDPYLNEEEIAEIFNLELNIKKLIDIRDIFIIGLWTGQRVSDFGRLRNINFVNNDILIPSSLKTQNHIKIPIHPQVKEILNRRNNELPKIKRSQKSWEILFNKEIKNLCNLAGINQKILGDKRNPETNRKVRAIYPKHELVSSHICRRSFVSNHYGKLPNKTIMAITGHKSESQFLDYVKISQDEHVEIVRQHWEKEK